MILYKIKHLQSGKLYIGQTRRSLRQRWSQHVSPASYCRYLKRAISLHGKDAFEITIIARAENLEQLAHRERYYIRLFNCMAPNGYNLTTGGEGATFHPSVGQKISAKNKGRAKPPRTKEHSAAISRAKMGIKTGPRPVSIMRAIHGKLKKPIVNVTLGSVYASATDAEAATGIHRSAICGVLKGKRTLAGGFSWRYAA